MKYKHLQTEYLALRQFNKANQGRIDQLLVLYRLQALGRAMPKYEQVTSLLAWIKYESGTYRRVFLTTGFLKRKISDLLALASAQGDLIALLNHLTTVNGNGGSPTQAYAQMEHGKTTVDFERARDAAKAAEEARLEAETLAKLAEREQYRTWKPSVQSERKKVPTVRVGNQGTMVDPSMAKLWEDK